MFAFNTDMQKCGKINEQINQIGKVSEMAGKSLLLSRTILCCYALFISSLHLIEKISAA